jgi:hypothetical protein
VVRFCQTRRSLLFNQELDPRQQIPFVCREAASPLRASILLKEDGSHPREEPPGYRSGWEFSHNVFRPRFLPWVLTVCIRCRVTHNSALHAVATFVPSRADFCRSSRAKMSCGDYKLFNLDAPVTDPRFHYAWVGSSILSCGTI